MMVKKRFFCLSPAALAVFLGACVHDLAVRPDEARAASAPAGAPRAGARRGIIECREDQACGSSVASGVAAPGVPVRADDLSIRVLRVGADGPRQVVDNGSALAPGAAFTIFVQSRRDAHVYLWHADPQGRLAELVGAAGALGLRDCTLANRLQAGQTLQLPAAGEHYTLDQRAGAERIYPVISAAPLCGAGRTRANGWLPAGTLPVDCSGSAGTCGEVFVINHLTRT